MAGATHGKTTTVKWNAQTIGQFETISAFGLKREYVDVTTFADDYKKYILGQADSPEITIGVNFDATDTSGQIAFIDDVEASTSRTLLITGPTSTGMTFSVTALPVGYEIQPAKDNAIKMTITVKPNGEPTFAVATSTGLTNPYFAVSESGAISPEPAGDVYEYVVNFLTGVTSFTITPTAAAGTIVIEANGASQTVNSGAASSAITLGDADSIIEVTITVTETSKAPLVYTIWACRAAGG